MNRYYCCELCSREVLSEDTFNISSIYICDKCYEKHLLIKELQKFNNTFVISNDKIYATPITLDNLTEINISYLTKDVIDLLDEYIVTEFNDISFLIDEELIFIDLECYTYK